MDSLLPVAIALFTGLMMTRLFKMLQLKLPDVTAFLIAGVCVGPFVLGRLGIRGLGFTTLAELEKTTVISNVALGFIAFDIGNEFRLSQLKQTGKTALVIGIVQAVFATILVDAALIGLHFILGANILPLPVAVTLGAIASATAPAATLMVVRQYKANGPLTDLLLPIVALDDAIGLIVFAVSFGVAQAIDGGMLNIVSILINPLIEILCSLTLGSLMGGILTRLEKLFYSNSNRLSLTIATVMITITLSSIRFSLDGGVEIGFSTLLVCMMLGAVFCNSSEYSTDIMARSGRWSAPLYATFFVLSGAQLDLGVLRSPYTILIGLLYILARSIGKYTGALSSAAIMRCEPEVKKHLGITLLPQAGVALGMVVTAQALAPAIGSAVRNIVLFGVLVYELFGPMLTKWALTKAGEITPGSTQAQYRSRFPHK